MVAEAKKSPSKKAADDTTPKKSAAKADTVTKAAKKSAAKAASTKKTTTKATAKSSAAPKKIALKPQAKSAAATGKTAAKATPTKKTAAKAATPKKSAAKAAVKKKMPKEDVTEATLRGMTPEAEARGSLVEVEKQKYGPEPVQRPETYQLGPLPTARELDRTYGDTKLVLLVRDPEWIFAYWEISPQAREKFGIPKDGHNKTMLLRWYDVTGLREFSGANANNIMDIQINDFSLSWYQKMPAANRAWCADLGIMDEKGRFVSICRSRVVQTPRNTAAPQGQEEEWAHADELRLRQIFEASGGAQLPTALHSGGILSSLGFGASERLIR